MRLRHRAAVIAAVAGLALTGLAAAGPAMAATAPAASAPAGSALAASAPAASAPGVKAGAAFNLAGKVTGLNVGKSTVTLGNSTVAVAPTAAVTVDGDTAKLVKLPIGADVKLSGTVKAGVHVATSVNATTTLPFVVAGSVTAVDAATGTVSVKRLSLGSSAAVDVLPVAAKAAITLDGRPVTLAALPVKAHILVTGTVTGGSAYSAKSLTAVSRWALNLSGTVTAVDAANGTVTVSTGTAGASNAAVKLNVDPKATIKLNGATVSLASLPIGATVGLSGSETTAGATVAGIDAKLGGTTKR